MGPVSTTPDNMHLMILVSLAAAASAAPQIVPYEHVEIAAEPYVHEEIEALPYIHEEPELTPLSLGVINRNRPAPAPVAVAPQQFAAPVAQQFAAPVAQQFAAPVAGVWTGSCINNLGQGVPCRAEAEAQAVAPQQQFVPQAQAFAQQQFVPQAQVFAQQQFVQPSQVAARPWNGACINNLGVAVPCSQ